MNAIYDQVNVEVSKLLNGSVESVRKTIEDELEKSRSKLLGPDGKSIQKNKNKVIGLNGKPLDKNE